MLLKCLSMCSTAVVKGLLVAAVLIVVISTYHILHLSSSAYTSISLSQLKGTNYNSIRQIADPMDTNQLESRPNLLTEVEHWIPDWYNQTDIGYVLRKRLHTVKERCKSYNGYRNSWKSKPFLRVAKTDNLAYCHTAKAGSTFWRNLIKSVNRQNRKLISGEKRTKIEFVTVRNPWHRLVSTYTQKFQNSIVKKRETTGILKICQMLNTQPTFLEFVKLCVLSTWRRGFPERHLLPAAERCDICNGGFDYIVAVENMAAEGYHVLSEAGVKNPKELFDRVRYSTMRRNEKAGISSNYQDYYKELDREDIESLRQMYSFDIHVFQYPNTPFVDFAKS